MDSGAPSASKGIAKHFCTQPPSLVVWKDNATPSHIRQRELIRSRGDKQLCLRGVEVIGTFRFIMLPYHAYEYALSYH